MKKIKLNKSLPILWTNNPARIKALFVQQNGDTISVHYPHGDIVVKPNPEVADPCGLIAIRLAGQPIIDTEKIVRESVS